jgi:hypothetical protein
MQIVLYIIGNKKMKKINSVVAIILILSFVISMAPAISVDAQTTREKETFPVIGATPNPIGLGQETLIWLGISDSKAYAWEGWEGLTVIVTKPDNTTDTLGPYKTDSTGSTGTVYIPTMTGTYYLQTHFPQQSYNWTSGTTIDPTRRGLIIYKESTTPKYALNVTDQLHQFYPSPALPTEYWSRPINSQDRNWNTISSSWLFSAGGTAQYVPYNDGPKSPHILWTKEYAFGGLTGGEFTDKSFETGDAYEGKWAGSVILSGRLFYNRDRNTGVSNTTQEVVSVDLHTGKELWSKVLGNNERLSFGQLLYWHTYNMYGSFPYLWTTTGTTMKAYDAFTGRLIYTMTNVPTGTNVYGPNGEILRAVVDLTNGWVALWNSSNIPALWGNQEYNSPNAYFLASWRPEGKSVDAQGVCPKSPDTPLGLSGYMWNITIPKGLQQSARGRLAIGDYVLGTTGGWEVLRVGDTPVSIWAISTKTGQQGLLWNKTWTPPVKDTEISFGIVSPKDGVFTLTSRETRQYWGFDINTGNLLWGPTESEGYMNMWTINHQSWNRHIAAYGNFYTSGMAGEVNAYNIKTGEKLWTYYATDPYTEALFSSNWPVLIDFVTDGMIYLTHAEHSPNDPRPRGAPTICLNATTGDVIWRIDGAFRGTWSGGNAIIGDSIIATLNTYDHRIYGLAKGPTAITLSAPDVSVELGKILTIKGTITDISPGTKDTVLAARFPNGVAAVSEESMNEWMLYVYQQFGRPTSATGVLLTINVVDSNGNYREIGTATSDADGFYSLNWKPDIEGKYTVYASFGGSESYWPSHAVTSFNVDPAAATHAPTATPQSDTATNGTLMTTMAVGVVAIIIAIAIVGLLLLRKRP